MEKNWYFHIENWKEFLDEQKTLEEEVLKTGEKSEVFDGVAYRPLGALPDVPLMRFSGDHPATNFDALGIEILAKVFDFPVKDKGMPKVATYAGIVRLGRHKKCPKTQNDSVSDKQDEKKWGYAILEPDRLSNFEMASVKTENQKVEDRMLGIEEDFHEKVIPNFYRVGRVTKTWRGRQTFTPRLMLDDRLSEIPVTLKVLRSATGKVHTAVIYSEDLYKNVFKLKLPNKKIFSYRYLCALCEDGKRMYMATEPLPLPERMLYDVEIPEIKGLTPENSLELTPQGVISVRRDLFNDIQSNFGKRFIRYLQVIRCISAFQSVKDPLSFGLLLTRQIIKRDDSRQIVKIGDEWQFYTGDALSSVIANISGKLYDKGWKEFYTKRSDTNSTTGSAKKSKKIFRLPCHVSLLEDDQIFISFSFSEYGKEITDSDEKDIGPETE